MKNTDAHLFPQWLYVFFVLSRCIFITLSVSFLALIFFDEGFITRLVNTLQSSVSAESVYLAIIYFQFFNSIQTLTISVVLSAGYYFILYVLFKEERKNPWIDIIFFTILNYLIFHYMLTRQDFLSICILALIYSLIYKLNKIDFHDDDKKYHSTLFAIPVLIPLLYELFFVSYVIHFLKNIKQRYFKNRAWDGMGYRISMILGANILAFIAVNLIHPSYDLPKGVKQIMSGRFYSMQFDESTNRLFACNNQENNLYIFDFDQSHDQPIIIKIDTEELQDLRINKNKREFYHFDRGTNNLFIFDLDRYILKKMHHFEFAGSGSARVCFDNSSHTIVVTRENDYVHIVDMDTLCPLKQIEIRKNDHVVYDRNTNHYIITVFQGSENMYLVSPKGEDIFKIKTELNQAGIAISNKRKELYVCFPLRSKIFVYDLKDFKLKRKIPTISGAKHVACDDMNDMIIISSIWSGFVDIVNLNNEKHSKIFVGYYLREVCLNKAKREAFISSLKSGIFKINY